jgi:hypothetical protein
MYKRAVLCANRFLPKPSGFELSGGKSCKCNTLCVCGVWVGIGVKEEGRRGVRGVEVESQVCARA